MAILNPEIFEDGKGIGVRIGRNRFYITEDIAESIGQMAKPSHDRVVYLEGEIEELRHDLWEAKKRIAVLQDVVDEKNLQDKIDTSKLIDPVLLRKPVYDLHMVGVRAMNAMEREGIKYVRDLLEWSDVDLEKKVVNMGKKSVREIVSALALDGLELKANK